MQKWTITHKLNFFPFLPEYTHSTQDTEAVIHLEPSFIRLTLLCSVGRYGSSVATHCTVPGNLLSVLYNLIRVKCRNDPLPCKMRGCDSKRS